MSLWNSFLSMMGGKGYTKKELSKLYQERHGVLENKKRRSHRKTKSRSRSSLRSRSRSNSKVIPRQPKFEVDSRIKSLVHTIGGGFWSIREILESGYLKPRKEMEEPEEYRQFGGEYGGSGEFVYLDPECESLMDKFTGMKYLSITLHISPKILEDRDNYYLGIGWPYGNTEKGQYYTKQDFKKWMDKIYKPSIKSPNGTESGGRCAHNEILFPDPIPLDKYLTKIVISRNLIAMEEEMDRMYKRKKFDIREYIPDEYLDLVEIFNDNTSVLTNKFGAHWF